jgi:hypothetical protein
MKINKHLKTILIICALIITLKAGAADDNFEIKKIQSTLNE